MHGKRGRFSYGNNGHHKIIGQEPANFLDVGGGASKEKVTVLN